MKLFNGGVRCRQFRGFAKTSKRAYGSRAITFVPQAGKSPVPWQDFDKGDTVRVRAIGKDGATQTDVVRAPDPDGSTGLHTIDISAG